MYLLLVLISKNLHDIHMSLHVRQVFIHIIIEKMQWNLKAKMHPFISAHRFELQSLIQSKSLYSVRSNYLTGLLKL